MIESLPSQTLGDLVELETEKALSEKDLRLPYIGLEHIAQGAPKLLGTAESKSSISVNSRFRKDDILFGKLRPNLKKSLRAPFDGYCSTDILVLRCREGVLPAFASHIFQWDHVFGTASATAAGTKMPRTSWGELRRLRVFAPKCEVEQSRIAAVLDTIDDAIAKVEDVIAKLEQVHAGLLHDLLTRGLDGNGQLRDPITHPEHFKITRIGRLPHVWETIRIGSLAEFINGNYGEPTFNYYQGPVDPRWYVTTGELLFAWSGTRETSFGPRIWAGAPGVLNQHIFKVVENPDLISRQFLYIILRENLERIAAAAHGFKDSFVHVKREELAGVHVPLPKRPEQDRIVQSAAHQENLIEEETANLEKLRKLKCGLMTDLLTGRVRVPVSLLDVEPEE
jgi:type I restriction enzyme S subunit